MREAIVNPNSRWWGDADHLVVVKNYLPSNYDVEVRPEIHDEGNTLVIFGEDVAGWTLDGYVLPRLASGGIYAEEVE